MKHPEVICPYCYKPAAFVTGAAVYPTRTDLAHKHFYLCTPCHALVGCHPPHGKNRKIIDRPLGRLANAELRRAKRDAHDAFDPLWRERAFPTRSNAYHWLSEQLGIPKDETHIGMMDVERCKAVVEACQSFRKEVLA